jgi:putative NIF3 family GTP cyclohydrolase 1 type 2
MAIKNDIAIYSIHTALDNHKNGVSHEMGVQLGLKNQRILIPKTNTLRKLTTYVPSVSVSKVLEALHSAGAGAIGNYYDCSFSTKGIGTFTGNDISKPNTGKPGKPERTEELQLHLTFDQNKEMDIIKALKEVHPYEEVAYEICELSNINQDIGMGSIGELEESMDEIAFFDYIKKHLNTPHIRHSNYLGREIKKVALLGGSGSFAIKAAKSNGADVLITADLKYHNFFEAENKIILMDIGHYETEQFTKKLIATYLTKKIPNFACILSQQSTNPVNYS